MPHTVLFLIFSALSVCSTTRKKEIDSGNFGFLGNDRFKRWIQKQLERRVEPNAKGWDRKSEKFRVNRVGAPLISFL
jgi:hypothetical protein